LIDEQELWTRICHRDLTAFDDLYRTYSAGLKAFLSRTLGSRQAAEDVAQETFAKIWQSPNGFDPARGTLRSYLFGAGRKRAAEWWRRQKRETAIVEDRGECRLEAQSVIGNALEKLPLEQRTLLWLREVEGLSYVELAAILEIPIGTVRSRLFAARKTLKEIWHGTRKSEEEW
jgi:RNA polymerase sigma-70 factor (ECF subfamily)